jgi:hypothetical protein
MLKEKDILSLGFQKENNSFYSSCDKNSRLRLDLKKHGVIIFIETRISECGVSADHVFKGKINNKKELKRILKAVDKNLDDEIIKRGICLEEMMYKKKK